MHEDTEKTETDLPGFEPLRKYHRRDRPVWSGIPVLLFLIFGLLLSGMFGLVAFLPLGIAALLFFKFRKQALRLPKWLYATAFLLLGLMMWGFFSNGPILPNPIGTWMYNHSGFDMMRAEPTVVVSDDDFRPARSQISKSQGDSSIKEPNKDTLGNVATGDKLGNTPTSLPDKQNDPPLKPENETTATPPNSDAQSFDAYINRGLKAVENEEYGVANQNFKNAFNANPRHPRLQQLAAEFRKTADEKCQDFKKANAKELSHIPNNYYQYAASLTQTVPLKCD